MSYFSKRVDGTPSGTKCRNRVIEWVCDAMLLSFGITCILSPETISRGSFRYLHDVGITSTSFIIITLSVGALRTVSLYYNGRGIPWTARVRALCALFGAFIFASMAWMLMYLTSDTGTLSLGVGTHGILAMAEIYSCLRAGADANEHPKLGVGIIVATATVVSDNSAAGDGNGPSTPAHQF